MFRSGKAYTFGPYNSEFNEKLKQLCKARWSRAKQTWAVDAEYIPTVRQIMYSIFGETDIWAPVKRYDVKLTFHVDVGTHMGDVSFFAKCLAHVYSDKSYRGIRVSDDVRYLSGDCSIRGTVDNWWAVVEQGSVVMVYDVPETLVQSAVTSPYVTYEFIERVPDSDPQLQPGA